MNEQRTRKILCVAFSVLTVWTLNACGDDGRFITPETAYIEYGTIYRDDGSGYLDYTVYYDAAGNEIRSEFYYPDGELSSWYDYSYVFQPDGKISEQRKIPDYSTWRNKAVYTDVYEYGENGLPVSVTRSKNGEQSSVLYYEYDDHGEQIRTLLANDDTQEPHQINESFSYSYDADGRKTGKQTYKENGELRSETIYEYDAAGLLIREIVTVPAEKKETTVNLNSEAYFSDSLTENPPDTVYEWAYTYDEQNRLISRICTQSGTLITSYTREYIQ